MIVDRLDHDDPAAAELASLCAFLGPAPVPEDLFPAAAEELPSELAARATNPLLWRQTLAHLTRQSLARIDQRSLSCTRLTQAILRERLTRLWPPPHEKAARRSWLPSDPRNPDNPATWSRSAQLMPHLLATDLGATDNSDLRLMARSACAYLLCRGDTRSGHDFAEGLRQHWRERLPTDHADTQVITAYLAWALRDMGRYAEARDLDEEVLDWMRRILGEDHPDTLTAANNLALDLRVVGEVQAARDLNQDTLERKTPGSRRGPPQYPRHCPRPCRRSVHVGGGAGGPRPGSGHPGPTPPGPRPGSPRHPSFRQ